MNGGPRPSLGCACDVRHSPARVVGRHSRLARHGLRAAQAKGGSELHAVCSLQTHKFGWEVVLEVNGLLSRSQVCRSRDEVLDLCEQWRAVMVETGWR